MGVSITETNLDGLSLQICCDEFREATTKPAGNNGDAPIELLGDAVCVSGCCGGCCRLTALQYCPFCGTEILIDNKV